MTKRETAKQEAIAARAGGEDRRRTGCLHEEVEGRLRAMVLVASHAVGTRLDDAARPCLRPDAARPGSVEIVRTPDGRTCRDDREATCGACRRIPRRGEVPASPTGRPGVRGRARG